MKGRGQEERRQSNRTTGHIRKGNWLVSPFTQMNMSALGWREEILPEVAWIGLAIWAEGKNFEQVLAEANDLMEWYLGRQQDKMKAPCVLFASEWNSIAEEDRRAAEEEAVKGRWELLTYGAERMRRRYGNGGTSPLAVERSEANEGTWNDDWMAIAETTIEASSKDTRLAVVLHWLILVWWIKTERLKWVEGQTDPRPWEWEEALRDPTTEVGARGASYIRCCVMGLFQDTRRGLDGAAWTKEFWNRPRQETTCMFRRDTFMEDNTTWTDEEWEKFNALSQATRDVAVWMGGQAEQALQAGGRHEERDYRTVAEGLLARCSSLFIGMAVNAMGWTWTMAPMALRCMVEAYIDLKYISLEPNTRAAKFMEHGLGEEMLAGQQVEDNLRGEGLRGQNGHATATDRGRK